MKRTTLRTLVLLFCLTILLFSACKKNNDDLNDNEIIGWVAGSPFSGFGTIFYTNDGGASWVRQGNASTVPEADLNDIRAIDKKNAWAAGLYEGGYAVILRTRDGGQTWQRQGSANELPNIELAGICPVNGDVCYAAGDSGIIVKTTDGGEHWSVIKADPAYFGAYQMIAAPDEDHVWAVGDGDTIAMIHYSSDGGQTWIRQGTDSLTKGNMPSSLIDIHARDANYIWAVGPSQALYTTDGGQTWHNKPTPVAFYHNNGVCIVNDQVVWVATDYNLIFKRTSMDGDWIEQHSTAEPAMYMGVTALDENRAWVVTAAFDNTGQILYTADGGASWTLQLTPAEVVFRRISFVNGKR